MTLILKAPLQKSTNNTLSLGILSASSKVSSLLHEGCGAKMLLSRPLCQILALAVEGRLRKLLVFSSNNRPVSPPLCSMYSKPSLAFVNVVGNSTLAHLLEYRHDSEGVVFVFLGTKGLSFHFQSQPQHCFESSFT